MNADQAKKLREPFKPEQIGRLPKGGAMLAYVGHAATTDRLLAVDPGWSWEPVAFDDRGLPRLDEHGGLWIRLTVCDVTKLGYGDASGKKGPNAVKEAIGDAIRNAAMRFGVALDLWAKEDLQPESHAPAVDDVSSVRAEILAIGKHHGWGAKELEQDFADQTDLDIRTASFERLAEYRDGLTARLNGAGA